MVQILEANPRRSFVSQLLGGTTEALSGIQQYLQSQNEREQLARQRQDIEKLGIPSNIPLELQKAYLTEQLRSAGKEKLLEQKLGALGGLFGGGRTPTQEMAEDLTGKGIKPQPTTGFDPSQISDESILKLSAIDPQMGATARGLKDVALREKRAEEKKEFEKEKFEEKKKETERAFHTGYSKKAEEAANNLRASLPKLEMALDFARNAIESADMTFFSPDKLADLTGVDLFRTAKGAQLVAAGKENLLNNISRVSAKAQNVWFEQRLASVFPKIGQSKEANLTVQEMLEGERLLDRAYLNEFDRLASEDEKQFGFVRKDIEKRARDATRPAEKDILRRTTYRMKEIEEEELGLNKIKSQVGKNVSKGTPLTLAMARLYKDKFGDKALDVAEKNGYYIPSIEEYQMIRSSTPEFRENLAP